MSTVTMKAARYYAAKDIRVEETSIPSVNKNQVKIEVKYVGICGSDLHEYLDGPIIIPMKEPHPLNGHCGVTIMGHEFSGVVVQVGDNVHRDNVKIGDRVVVEPIFRNPDSFYTMKGEYNLSEPIGGIGLTGNGGFAKYVVVEDYMVHKIPDSITFEQGALVEPAAVAVYAVKTSGLQLGETCVIFGAGPIGLLCLQAVMAAGAARTIVVDIAEKRLEKARELGATLIINGKEENISQQIKNYTDGLGANVYFDAAGVQSTFTTGIASLRKGGRAILIALFGKPVTLNAFDLVLREITIKGIAAYRHIFPEVIKLIDGKQMNVERIITKKIKLDDIVKDGFEALASDPSEIKILIDIASN
ncbi:unnamed protein product [Rotaria sordida]|uniref:Sorbitol dehydrogenase n=1 Tax=Rotaria sordida TaxID=392033 RepID=A0A814LNY7_9BILA|nr:unnamed protein product [Rotaria sordida]CAF1067272.1 unnamed protein product [Rotaria sordida]CAF3778284.1 unnamed protein product [Rotaria sordida]CAF4059915.1 unnamed protein product [Rotaria sordida]